MSYQPNSALVSYTWLPLVVINHYNTSCHAYIYTVHTYTHAYLKVIASRTLHDEVVHNRALGVLH